MQGKYVGRGRGFRASRRLSVRLCPLVLERLCNMSGAGGRLPSNSPPLACLNEPCRFVNWGSRFEATFC